MQTQVRNTIVLWLLANIVNLKVSDSRTKLIIVLGHTHCGAVQAAVNLPEDPGHIVTLINAIKPAVEKARLTKPAVLLDAAIRENVMQVDQLRVLEPVLATRVREGSVKIIGAFYDLHSGEMIFSIIYINYSLYVNEYLVSYGAGIFAGHHCLAR